MGISRRAILAIPLAAACGRRGPAGYQGYAFVANQDGQAVAAVDLEAMAVVRHIPLDGSPAEVLAAAKRPSVYALAPDTGSVYEIQVDRLTLARKVTVATRAVAMRLDSGERNLWVLASDPRAILRVAVDSFRVTGRIALNEDPLDFAIASEGNLGAVAGGGVVRFVDLEKMQLGATVAEGDFSAVRFRKDGKMLIGADRSARLLWLWDAPAEKLMTKLPLAVTPENLCFSQDGGQLFVTGAGLDGVVIVFPYHTPEVDQTVLAGRGPQAMAASQSLLFVASPQSGDVSVMSIDDRKVVSVVRVGSDPGFVAVTPDDQYALVLNRKSGDVAVLRVRGVQTRGYPAPVLTVIPVGSRPVSAAIRGV